MEIIRGYNQLHRVLIMDDNKDGDNISDKVSYQYL